MPIQIPAIDRRDLDHKTVFGFDTFLGSAESAIVRFDKTEADIWTDIDRMTTKEAREASERLGQELRRLRGIEHRLSKINSMIRKSTNPAEVPSGYESAVKD